MIKNDSLYILHADKMNCKNLHSNSGSRRQMYAISKAFNISSSQSFAIKLPIWRPTNFKQTNQIA